MVLAVLKSRYGRIQRLAVSVTTIYTKSLGDTSGHYDSVH